jgi:hypothetical protein
VQGVARHVEELTGGYDLVVLPEGRPQLATLLAVVGRLKEIAPEERIDDLPLLVDDDGNQRRDQRGHGRPWTGREMASHLARQAPEMEQVMEGRGRPWTGREMASHLGAFDDVLPEGRAEGVLVQAAVPVGKDGVVRGSERWSGAVERRGELWKPSVERTSRSCR